MELSLTFYVVAGLAVLVTGLSKSGFGGGLGVMAVPTMSLFVAPQFAVAVLMPILLAMDVLIVWRYRKSWSGRVILSLLPGALAGLALGAVFFEYMDADLIKVVVGSLALIFVAEYLVRQRQSEARDTTRIWVPSLLGLTSGFASFVAHAGGPPVKGYLLKQGLDKTTFVGTNTIFFFTMNAIKTVAYGASGTMGPESFRVSLLLVPALVLGLWLGARLHHLIDQSVFVKVVYAFLALTALRLLWDGLPGVLGT